VEQCDGRSDAVFVHFHNDVVVVLYAGFVDGTLSKREDSRPRDAGTESLKVVRFILPFQHTSIGPEGAF
jgi:hypothetical protein